MNLDFIKELCTTSTEELKVNITRFLHQRGYQRVWSTKDYIMAEGNIPICLIAHMDTVFSSLPREFFYDQEQKVLWSPTGAGFDDRAGIYAIISILEDTNYYPSVIFLDQEEHGGIGARALIHRFKKCPFACNALIELDRANFNDSVFYDCDNKAFEKYINKFGFKTNWGTFSDISVIAPAWGIAAVNLSIGYVDEHFATERLYTKQCDKTIKRVTNILRDINDKGIPFFKYIPFIYQNYHSYTPTGFFDNMCLMCGKELKEGETYYRITDKNDEYSYNVCKDCYHEYY